MKGQEPPQRSTRQVEHETHRKPVISHDMKRCAIITLHCPHNFGAMLQAYALQTAIISMGHSAEIIDFGSHPGPPGYVHGKSWLKRIPHMTLCFLQRHSRKRRFDRFASFRDGFLKRTKAYPRHEDLIESPPEHDVLLCGSDQIWNPTRHEFQPELFLHIGLPAANQRRA